MKKELALNEEQIRAMACQVSRNLEQRIMACPLKLAASDSYGAINHKTWIFTVDTELMVGAIERYWDGLKMIVSVNFTAPRTYFFTEAGERTNSKDLKQVSPQ